MQNVTLNLNKKERAILLGYLALRRSIQVPIHTYRNRYISIKKRLWNESIGLMTIGEVVVDGKVTIVATVEFNGRRFIEPTILYNIAFNDDYSPNYVYPTY